MIKQPFLPVRIGLCLLGLTAFYRGDRSEPWDRIVKICKRADSLFHLNQTTEHSDSEALAGFNYVIKAVEHCPPSIARDSLLARSYLKKGILLDVKLDYAGARDAYCRSLQLLSKSDDSLIFVASVFAGASFYNLNVFDSCNEYLLQAEARADRYSNTDDAIRLYNTLGVLYHDNGNYLQGKNYFTRALQIIEGRKPFDTASAVNIQTNMAACEYRLGRYREALDLYNKILAYKMFTPQIHMNMGMAYALLEKYGEALRSFRKVNVNAVPSVLNEMGDVYLKLKKNDSAAACLDRLAKLAGNASFKTSVNQADLGINDLLHADLMTGEHRYLDALRALQHAMAYFARDFNNPDIYANPTDFTGTYACYRLFEALTNKAGVFESLYHAEPLEKYLTASYDAYRSALSLLRYIERSYDTDDAKIFLKKKNSALYHAALSVCLELYRLHPEKDYLAQAFLISEKSKASIIAANLKERVFSKVPGVGEALLNKERNIKYNIARLNASIETAPNSKELLSIENEKAGFEIELARVQKDLERNGNFYRLKYDDTSPGIAEFQAQLGKDQVLFAFAETDDALHVFALTRSSFSYTRIDSLAGLQKDVGSWLEALRTAESGRRFQAGSVASDLYGRLIKPMQTLAGDKNVWTVVPDGFLYFLPFESLPAGPDPNNSGRNRYLLETVDISYQFSARLMLAGTLAVGKIPESQHPGEVLAFAPFASSAGEFGREKGLYFGRLPSSINEIEGLPGKYFIDRQATKEQFLQQMNRYPILHLATHAVSSVSNAASSFIAFYPVKGTVVEDCLFLEELYGLNLNATRLVVISACETGQGELVNNEGVISLARAFAYAGCESSVNSLWKADDQSTGFILKRFHVYLEKGYDKSLALRKAKLDYLHSDALNKSPAYWAHLILMGNTAPVYHTGFNGRIIILLAAVPLLLIGGAWFFYTRKKSI